MVGRLMTAVCLALVVLAGGCSREQGGGKKLLLLAIDGMDYTLLRGLMEEGKMPNFERLAAQGGFAPLATTIPPQSPVAWSSFITGMNPGHTAIFDFLHRDPDTMLPYLSTSRVEGAGRTLSFGKWVFPLSGGEAVQLRRGTPWWEILEAHGIPATVVKIPANFPATGQRAHVLSGMGTPDIQGTYGRFTFFTTAPERFEKELSGGELTRVEIVNDTIETALLGPTNTFLKERPKATVDLRVYLDAENSVAKIVVGDSEFILQEKEWSDWVEVEFTLIPYFQSVSGICRFYLKRVRPEFELYVTPVNLNPAAPALPISAPPEFSQEIADALGPYYTQGMAEDTKALTDGVFTDEEFLRQAEMVFAERKRLYDYFLDRFDSGVLFFYFSSVDQVSHMMWRAMDPAHPGHDPEADAPHAKVIEDLYLRMDKVLGETLEKVAEDTTILVLSDHGFAPWYRAFHLNTWLLDHGYITLRDPTRQGESEFFGNVDWTRTKAYGLGLNGLYINQLGREPYGMVRASDVGGLLEEISRGLVDVRDPANDQPVVSRVYESAEVFSGEGLELAPDLIVGFHRGYRNSNESSVGRMPPEMIVDNLDPWSGDHCIAADLVPGILLANRSLATTEPRLMDLAATILKEFEITPDASLEGRALW